MIHYNCSSKFNNIWSKFDWKYIYIKRYWNDLCCNNEYEYL